jgi:dipeptidyl aminopeptidase/acylaminoacyl peptidase
MPSAQQLVAGDFEAFGAKWSPTGKHLAFLISQNWDTQLAVYDMQSSSYQILDDVFGWGSSTFAWSPNGLRIAYASQSEEDDWQPTISVANILTGEIQEVTSGSEPVWYIDDTTLLARCSSSVYGSSDRWSEEWTLTSYGFCRINAVTGESQRAIDIDAWNMSFSPTLGMIAFETITQTEDAESFFTNLETEFEEFVGAVVADNPSNFAEGRRDLSRELEARRFMEEKRSGMDAESLPFSSDLFVMSLDGGGPTQLTHDGRSSLISWTPDGRRILFATAGSTGNEVGMINPDGSDPRKVIDASLKPIQPSSVTITHDGKYALFVSQVDADAGIATIMTGESPADLHVVRIGSSSAKRLENQHPFKQRFALSPDGKRLVYEVLEDVRVLQGQERRELWVMSR